MADLSFLELVFVFYLALVFAKTLLCYATLNIAVATVARYSSIKRSVFWGVLFVILIPFTCFIVTPVLLVQERLAFFGVYSRFYTMREVLRSVL